MRECVRTSGRLEVPRRLGHPLRASHRHPRRRDVVKRLCSEMGSDQSSFSVWSLFRSGKMGASSFPTEEISFVLTAEDKPHQHPKQDKDGATDSRTALPARESEEGAVAPSAPQLVCEASGGAGSVVAEGRTAENRAQWLLGTYRADPDGLARACGSDKETLLAIFHATALHKLKRQRWLLKPLKAQVIRNITNFHVDEIASLAKAMHRVGYLRTDFLYAASTVIARTARVASPASCGFLLEAFAAQRFEPEQAVHALCNRLRETELQGLTQSHLASIVSSLARLNITHDPLLADIANRLLDLWSTACASSPPGVREVATLHPGAERSTTLPENVALQGRRQFSPHDVTQVLYGLTKLQYHHSSLSAYLLGTVLPGVVGRMHSHQLTVTAVAIQRAREHAHARSMTPTFATDSCNDYYASEHETLGAVTKSMNLQRTSDVQERELKVLQEMAFGLVVNEVAKRLPQFKAESICMVFRACAVLGVRDNWLVVRLIALLPRLLLTFDPEDAVLLSVSLSELGAHSGASVDLIAGHAKQNSNRYSPHLLNDLLFSFSREGIIVQDFLDMYVDPTRFWRVTDGRAATTVVCALSDSGCKDRVVIQRIFDALLPLLPTLRLDDLFNLYAAVALLGLTQDIAGIHEVVEHVRQRLNESHDETVDGKGLSAKAPTDFATGPPILDLVEGFVPDVLLGPPPGAPAHGLQANQTISVSGALNLSLALLVQDFRPSRDARSLTQLEKTHIDHCADPSEGLQRGCSGSFLEPALLAADIAAFCTWLSAESSIDVLACSPSPQSPGPRVSSFFSLEEQRKLGLLQAALLLRADGIRGHAKDERKLQALTTQVVDLLSAVAALQPAAVPFRLHSTASCISALRVPLRHVCQSLRLREVNCSPNGVRSSCASEMSHASPAEQESDPADLKPRLERLDLIPLQSSGTTTAETVVQVARSSHHVRPAFGAADRTKTHVSFIERSTASGLAAMQSILEQFFGVRGTIVDSLSDVASAGHDAHASRQAVARGEPLSAREDGQKKPPSGARGHGSSSQGATDDRDRLRAHLNPYTGLLHLELDELLRLPGVAEDVLSARSAPALSPAPPGRGDEGERGDQLLSMGEGARQAAAAADSEPRVPRSGVILLWADAQHFWHAAPEKDDSKPVSPRADFALSNAAAFQLRCFERLTSLEVFPAGAPAAGYDSTSMPPDLSRQAQERKQARSVAENRNCVVLVPHFVWNAVSTDTEQADFLLKSIKTAVEDWRRRGSERS
ncbi:hypothetical protein BESB_040730 [Besnoitia besnoiti]|uniref:Uncharacterized protein n=1 Tax=Besnoitia besnoiti TaxID=94643 RepID=A0A2A9MI08_BESBE|nr:hypothetical protein BESB_040730 [Besnoitia besnoiti]PFH37615.1 hypothetical protein BESB_040730 [Besnoitia besnoiti]